MLTATLDPPLFVHPKGERYPPRLLALARAVLARPPMLLDPEKAAARIARSICADGTALRTLVVRREAFMPTVMSDPHVHRWVQRPGYRQLVCASCRARKPQVRR